MKITYILIKRNVKLFFKDKGLFFTALITPLILLVLYATFLGNVYKDSFMLGFPEGVSVNEELIDSLVAAQLLSSILAVSCVTIAFCSNFLMVSDKAHGTAKDLLISPIKSTSLSLSYYIASLFSTLIICFFSAGLCLIYQAIVGWHLSLLDVLCIFLDVFILSLFGTALSSIINYFLKTQGQISAVGSIVSSGYGFICGAYMPISSFSEGLQTAVLFLPGSYGTSLLRHHSMRGILDALSSDGIADEIITITRDAVDCNLYFGDTAVSEGIKFAILGGSAILLVLIYVIMNLSKRKER